MKLTTVSFVIPTYNERESLRELFSSIKKTVQDHRWSADYIFVDDGSTDGSFELLKNIKKTSRDAMTLIRFRKNSGKSMALSEGFRLANGDVVVTLDADLQDDPSELPKLMDKLEQKYDLVVGWRKSRQDQRGKLRLSYVFNSVVSALAHVPLHDMNCGMKVMRQAVAKEIEVYGELHRYIPVLAHSRGFKVAEIPVVHHPRKYGVSKFGSERIMRAAFDLITTLFLTTFRNRPLHVFGPVGVLSVFAGIVSLTYLSVLHFMGQSIGRRPLLFLGILFVLFGVQLISTGLIGELITEANIHKQRHPIEEIIV